jgi:hypothetical protein
MYEYNKELPMVGVDGKKLSETTYSYDPPLPPPKICTLAHIGIILFQ